MLSWISGREEITSPAGDGKANQIILHNGRVVEKKLLKVMKSDVERS